MIFTCVQTHLCCDLCGGAQLIEGRPFSVSYNRSYSQHEDININELISDRKKWNNTLPEGWGRVDDTVLCPFCNWVERPRLLANKRSHK